MNKNCTIGWIIILNLISFIMIILNIKFFLFSFILLLFLCLYIFKIYKSSIKGIDIKKLMPRNIYSKSIKTTLYLFLIYVLSVSLYYTPFNEMFDLVIRFIISFIVIFSFFNLKIKNYVIIAKK